MSLYHHTWLIEQHQQQDQQEWPTLQQFQAQQTCLISNNKKKKHTYAYAQGQEKNKNLFLRYKK